MFCYKCGAQMPDQSTACSQCGAPVQATPQPAAASSGAASAPAPAPASPWLNVPALQAYAAQQETDGKAVGSLILGILAIFPLWILAGIPAIILGHLSQATIRKSMGRKTGEGMAIAGLVMGYLSVGLTLIVFAIAIPNALRARNAANESAAASTVRTLNITQVTYSTTYPDSGYAISLAVLGPGAPPVSCGDASHIDAYHACLLDSILGCSSAGWCEKYGYKFHINAICSGNSCQDYVITATPVNSSTGLKSYCSTSDAVVRVLRAGPLREPLTTVHECETWASL